MSKNILIVDDEKKIVDVVEAYLLKEGFNTFIAKDGKEAIEMFAEYDIDLMILDIMMPKVNGFDVCMYIRSVSDTPIIILSAKVKEEDKLFGIQIGADDYITKPFSIRELISRVKAVLRRCYRESSPLAEYFSFNKGEVIVDFKKFKSFKNGKELKLTPNEFKLLKVLVINRGLVLSREQIVEKAFGIEFDGFDRTIDVHIKNLRYKIEDIPRRPKYIHTVYGVGYKFIGGEEI